MIDLDAIAPPIPQEDWIPDVEAVDKLRERLKQHGGLVRMDDWEFQNLVQDEKLASRAAGMYQVNELLAAGWDIVLPDLMDSEPWQWSWRRPGKRQGKPGRLFQSTNQAYMAMKREQT